MLIRAAIVFLLVMVLIGMIGKALFPHGRLAQLGRRRPGRCRHCGRPLIGGGCDCGRGR